MLIVIEKYKKVRKRENDWLALLWHGKFIAKQSRCFCLHLKSFLPFFPFYFFSYE
jgi:hypothetical protein